MQGTYIGPTKAYKGETALIRKGKRGKVLVQFDNMKDWPYKAHGWHEFLAKHWIIQEFPNDGR